MPEIAKNLAKKDPFGNRLIEVGQIVPLMGNKLFEGLQKVCVDNAHRTEVYWVLYTADWYMNGEQLKDSFTPWGKKPPKMLNTICWRVDNVTGRFDEEWVLPPDAPIQITDETNEFDDMLIESSKGIDIIY